MKEQTLFRQGKAILRARYKDDGTVLLYKPFTIRPIHVMNMTGAPGWDARYVDQIFTEGVDGSLQYTQARVDYTIDIASFRRHAFIRDDGFFPQYHVQVSHYATGGWKTRDLTLEFAEEKMGSWLPTLPEKLVFGDSALCPACKGKGKIRGRKACERCHGLGIIPNIGPVAMTPPEGMS